LINEDSITMNRSKGFTLAELLIALAILGVIATFTIPKVLTSTGTAQFKAVAKETASIISGAYQDYAMNYAVSTSMAPTIAGLLANVNYVSTSTAATAATGLPAACTATTCVVLHNGAIMQWATTNTFGGTTGYLAFNVDPDGTKSASTTDIVSFGLFYNGALKDQANLGSATQGGTALTLSSNTTNPSWFNWQ
jgi:prepilin-type N-terminal cleavage/methylation domain-containing protein